MMVALQVFGLTAFTVSYPFRFWLVMLDAEEAHQEARRMRDQQRSLLEQDIQNELAMNLALATDYGKTPAGVLGPVPALAGLA